MAGAGIALFAAIDGIISQILGYSHFEPVATFAFTLAAYAATLIVAIAVLLRIRRPVIIGVLQGMWWLAVWFVAGDIVNFLFNHVLRNYAGRALAGEIFLIVSDVVGVGAVILLLVAWSPAVGKLRAPRLSVLPVMLLCGVGLSQGAQMILYVTQYRRPVDYIQGIAAILVGLVITWYAISLRTAAHGGALVLGWAITSTFVAIINVTPWSSLNGTGRLVGVLGCVVTATVVILAISYMRQPSEHNNRTRLGPPQQDAATAPYV